MGRKPAPAAPTIDLSHIAEGLRPLAVPIDDLVMDPINARLHPEANLESIRGSLRQFGQRRPAVVRREGLIVIAGNGMLAAARDLGWTHLAVVLVDDDQATAAAFAIADNRTAELAEWDKDTLAKVLDIALVGDEDLQQMLSNLAVELEIIPPDDTPARPPAEETPEAESFNVLVKCPDESSQADLIEELTKRGLACSAVDEA